MMGMAGASKWEQEIQTWLGKDFAEALLDAWERKHTNIEVMKAKSERVLSEVIGRDFTFM